MATPPQTPLDEDARTLVHALLHAARNAMQRTQTVLSLLRIEAADQSELIDEAESASDALASLFETARRYVAPVAAECCPLEVVAVVQRAFEDACGAHRDATLEVDPAQVVWPVDPALFRDALHAVLANARDARPNGLEVRATMRVVTGDAGRRLAIEISDNGPGLVEPACEHALEPFWSTRAGATGMGLAFANRAVRAHGGRLAIGNGPDRGARALIEIPEAPAGTE